MFLDISAGYSANAILIMGQIAFGLRPRTRSRPGTIRTCAAGPERPGPEPLAWRPGQPRRRGRRRPRRGRADEAGHNEAAIGRPGPIALEVPIASCRSPDRWLFSSLST